MASCHLASYHQAFHRLQAITLMATPRLQAIALMAAASRLL
jgi:hypothetical protein